MKNKLPPLEITWSESALRSYKELDPDGLSAARSVLRGLPESKVVAGFSGKSLRIMCKQEVIDATDPATVGATTRLVLTVVPFPQLGLVRIMSIEQLPPELPKPPRGARSAMGIAVRVAGPTRAHLRNEWLTLLIGCPEDGWTPSLTAQRLMVLGFLVASIRMRLHDVARPAWRPLDWLLKKASRTSGVITAVVGAQAIYIVGHQGLGALVTDVWEPCAVAGASLYGLACWLRRVRGIAVEPSGHEAADE
ncbi:hypothetical protein ACF07B_36160 [Streptomyces sp. NPDC015532]|uniref:hypothetical protein n=1 Tax=Streptomyces sp. NPDC015532 TaxID=3364960 RepID=UPI0036F53874